MISYVGGAESVYSSNFNDLIVGDDTEIFFGGSGDDRIEGGSSMIFCLEARDLTKLLEGSEEIS